MFNLLLGSLLIFLPILFLSDHSTFEGFLQILPFLALSLQYKRPRLNLDLEIVIAREPISPFSMRLPHTLQVLAMTA